MCGIIGFIGETNAAKVLLKGLEKLEYRGYDSAGIALMKENRLSVLKTDKRIAHLEKLYVNLNDLVGNVGLGHTRWATHGEPSVKNAHPHLSMDKKIAVVHNGIIENAGALRRSLEAEGIVFESDTDSEVIPNLIAKNYKGNLLEAVHKTLNLLEGSYALGIMSTDEPDKLIAVKQFSPLVIGLFENENYIASDVAAFINRTNKVIFPADRELVLLTKEKVTVYSPELLLAEKKVETLNLDKSSSEKGGFEHFMLKEIMEQPLALQNTLESRIVNGKICFKEITLPLNKLKQIKKINIIACGSAYHAGLAAKYVFEDLTKIPTEVELASEFRYKNPIINQNTLTIAISQSGETADTLAALMEAKKLGSHTLSVVNVAGSSIATASDSVLYTMAGPEISVATTKGYTTQVGLLYLFALWLAEILNSATKETVNSALSSLLNAPKIIAELLKEGDKLKKPAQKIQSNHSVFFIGRNIDYAVAQEGSLKLKEISYIHSEAYAAGELKHGTISLIENGTPVFALSSYRPLKHKLLTGIKEVKARGGFIISFTQKENEEIAEASDEVFFLPDFYELFYPLIEVIPLQLLAYFVAVNKGLDVDKPRNLAKSVTVE